MRGKSNSPNTFRFPQTISSKTSGHLGLYEASLAVVLDYNNNINLIKNRYGKKQSKLSVDEAVELMMDMLCRMIFKGRMEMFQEGMKQNLCKAIKETLKGGDPDEDTV